MQNHAFLHETGSRGFRHEGRVRFFNLQQFVEIASKLFVDVSNGYRDRYFSNRYCASLASTLQASHAHVQDRTLHLRQVQNEKACLTMVPESSFPCVRRESHMIEISLLVPGFTTDVMVL